MIDPPEVVPVTPPSGAGIDDLIAEEPAPPPSFGDLGCHTFVMAAVMLLITVFVFLVGWGLLALGLAGLVGLWLHWF